MEAITKQSASNQADRASVALRRRGRLGRRVSLAVLGLFAGVGSLATSSGGAHASERPAIERPAAVPATVTVCFRHVHGYPFANASVITQYRTVNGGYQNVGGWQRTNAYGCVVFRVTGGFIYRFYATNYSAGIVGTPSSGVSTAYSVYAGGNYHYGVWYVQ